MKEQVKVSVVIPVYNAQSHLRQCLDSVAAQTLEDIEVICVDDGSTDESPAILAGYASRDPRFQVLTQANAGPGAARNAGMALASGEYLILLDSDDWVEPTMLEDMLRRAKETDADVTICKAVEFDTNTGRALPSQWMLKTQYLPGALFSSKDISTHMFQFTYGWPWDKLYKTEFVRAANLSFPPLRNSEDLGFVFLSLAAAEKIAILDKTLVHHRVNRMASVSNSRHRDPEVPFQALRLFRDELKSRGLYERYEQSFLNWAMEFVVWNAANMGSAEAQNAYLRLLKQEWLPSMRFETHPRSYYYSGSIYLKYLLIRYAPRPVFSAVVSCYKKGKSLLGGRA